MSCVFRVSGDNFEVDKFLEESVFSPCKIFRKGEPKYFRKPNGPVQDYSGINIDVSEADFNNIEGQISDAIKFITTNEAELSRIVKYSGVESVCFDFAVERNDMFVQSISFPKELLFMVGTLGADIELSIYPESKVNN